MLSPGPLKARRIIRVHARHRCRWREVGLGRVDPLQRPVKGTVYNASLVNYHIDMDTTNGNMPVSGACNGSSWATAAFVRVCDCHNSIL